MGVIKITCAGTSAHIKLLPDFAPDTINNLISSLPIESTANLWGEEVYFPTTLNAEPENQHEVVEKGDVAYWPPGKALCIFFGPTPASKGNEIRPASPVNVIGKIQGDPGIFKNIKDGDTIKVERLE